MYVLTYWQTQLGHEGNCKLPFERSCLSMHCVAEELRSLAARADLAAVAQRGEVMSRLAYLLEVFRGCMRGSGPKSQPALLGIVKQIADPLVRLSSAPYTHYQGSRVLVFYAWDLQQIVKEMAHALWCPCLRCCLAPVVTSILTLCQGISAWRLSENPSSWIVRSGQGYGAACGAACMLTQVFSFGHT